MIQAPFDKRVERPQPRPTDPPLTERERRVFEALKRGLGAILKVIDAELDGNSRK